jgi:hypothetical protein
MPFSPPCALDAYATQYAVCNKRSKISIAYEILGWSRYSF